MMRWSETETARLLAMWEGHYEVKEIARELARTPKSVSSRIEWLRKTGTRIGRRTRRARAVRLACERSCHPLVRFFYAEMNRQQASFDEVAARSGVSEHALREWGRRVNPRVTSLAAALGALGYEIAPRPIRGLA